MLSNTRVSLCDSNRTPVLPCAAVSSTSKAAQGLNMIQMNERTRWHTAIDTAKGHLGQLSNRELSALIGVSPAMLTHYNSGRHLPTSDAWQKINQVTGISPNYVLCGIGEPLTHAPVPSDGQSTVIQVFTHLEYNSALEFMVQNFAVEIPSGIGYIRPSQLRMVVKGGFCRVLPAEEAPSQEAISLGEFMEGYENR